MLLCAALLLVVSVAHAYETMSVVSPASLKTLYPSGISERPALFGNPSYASSITGTIIYSTPGDRDACKALDSLPTTTGALLVVMVDRGNCTFVQKVRNAQNVGAAAVIVVDNVNEAGIPFMADDGTGNSITIPSMLIHKTDGQNIKDSITAGETVVLTMEWSLPHPDGIVEWSFWTSANDARSIEFKSVFGEAVEALGPKAVFTPRYYIINGASSGCMGSHDPCGNQCTNSGRYCAVDPEGDTTTGVSGQDIVTENLRQICIWKLVNSTVGGYSDLWWNYVTQFDADCAPSSSTWNDDCAGTILGNLGLSHSWVTDCMANSGGTTADAENYLLEEEMQAKADGGIFYLPTVTINNVAHRGTLDCPEPLDVSTCTVLEGICAGFATGTAPAACTSSPGCSLGEVRDECNVCNGDGMIDKCGSCKSQASESFDVCSDEASSSSFPVAGIITIVAVCVAVVGLGVYMYMRRQQAAMRDDIDALLKRYLPLEGEDGVGGSGAGAGDLAGQQQLALSDQYE